MEPSFSEEGQLQQEPEQRAAAAVKLQRAVVTTASSDTDGGAAIVGSAVHRQLAAHTDNDEGTTAPGVTDSSSRLERQAGALAQGVGRRGGSAAAAEGRYSRPDLELCASLDLPSASEATALALIHAGATAIAMPQPPRAYRVMAASLFETVVPALRVTVGQDEHGRAQERTQRQPDAAEPRYGAIVELEGALLAGGTREYHGLSRSDVDTVRGWLVAPRESGLGPWGASLGFALPPIAAAGSSSRAAGAEHGGMEEAARSLRRLIDDVLLSLPRPSDGRENGAIQRRPRVIAKIDGRAGEEAALAALSEAQAGPVDEVIVLTGDAANSWAAAGAAGAGFAAVRAPPERGGTSRTTVAKVVQEAEAGGLRTLVEVACADDAMPLRAHGWAGTEPGDGSSVVGSGVVGTAERASNAAAEIGSGGVWLTGPGSGSTNVVAAAALGLGAHTQ